MSAQLSSMRHVPLAALTFSTTPAQKERRQHFDKDELKELAESIRGAGVLQAILVRPFRDEHVSGEAFEVVAGERRVLAAREAGLEEIPATVRELTDDQVVELQLIENLQRAGLHELAEAEGYEQLLKHGHSAEEIAEKVGKSKGYVYGRMKLLACGPATREAFYRGELTASTALLLARIPVASVQREACGKITRPGYGDGPLSYRAARDLIEREYMLRLSEAPFDTKLEDLVKGAVACGRCPKNTLSQPELFGDVKSGSAGVCTDPTCFKAKREAGIVRHAEEARARGQTVITGHEAKKIAPHGEYSLQGGYVRFDGYCPEDAKGRTFKQLLGRGAKPTLLEVNGELIPVVNRAEALKQAKAAGTLELRQSSVSTRDSKPKDRAAEKIEKEFRRRLFLAIHAKAPKKLSKEVLASLAGHELDMIGTLPPEFLEAWGLTDDINMPRFEKLTEPQLCQILWELLIVEELHMGTDEHATQKLTNVAKSLSIDSAAIRKEIAAEQKAATPAPAKASKKKAKVQ
jgi:ParB/RepB/Spo0J family partition protein